jgi:hypothetical protein
MNGVRIWYNLMYDPGISLEELRKTKKEFRISGLWAEI